MEQQQHQSSSIRACLLIRLKVTCEFSFYVITVNNYLLISRLNCIFFHQTKRRYMIINIVKITSVIIGIIKYMKYISLITKWVIEDRYYSKPRHPRMSIYNNNSSNSLCKWCNKRTISIYLIMRDCLTTGGGSRTGLTWSLSSSSSIGSSFFVGWWNMKKGTEAETSLRPWTFTLDPKYTLI